MTEFEVDAQFISYATAVIEAETEEQALEIAKAMPAGDWHFGDVDEIDLDSVIVVGGF